mmetsp:Transcript_46279/g.104891  ORF Transcript_46279/g.104891 Transcript_46279/m.104891 type:complete len:381 (+) Transcript_46279:1287-2429(+)
MERDSSKVNSLTLDSRCLRSTAPIPRCSSWVTILSPPTPALPWLWYSPARLNTVSQNDSIASSPGHSMRASENKEATSPASNTWSSSRFSRYTARFSHVRCHTIGSGEGDWAAELPAQRLKALGALELNMRWPGLVTGWSLGVSWVVKRRTAGAANDVNGRPKQPPTSGSGSGGGPCSRMSPCHWSSSTVSKSPSRFGSKVEKISRKCMAPHCIQGMRSTRNPSSNSTMDTAPDPLVSITLQATSGRPKVLQRTAWRSPSGNGILKKEVGTISNKRSIPGPYMILLVQFFWDRGRGAHATVGGGLGDFGGMRRPPATAGSRSDCRVRRPLPLLPTRVDCDPIRRPPGAVVARCIPRVWEKPRGPEGSPRGVSIPRKNGAT